MNKSYHHFIETVNCPVCGENRQVTYIEVKYHQLKQKFCLDYSQLGIKADTPIKIQKCLNCGFVFVNPRVKKKYEDLIYNASKKTMYESAYQGLDGLQQRNERQKKIAHLSPLLQACAYVDMDQKAIKLFDFGCGYGYSIEIAKTLKIEAYGVDIDRGRLDICREKGLNVAHPNEFDKLYPELQADIVLWQSNIEHLIDPQITIQYIKEKCKKGTVLFVNGLTPRLIDIERKRGAFVKAHFIEHINYFPRRTLDRFMGEHGFVSLPKPKMAVMKSITDGIWNITALLAGQFIGHNPLKGTFSRLFRFKGGHLR